MTSTARRVRRFNREIIIDAAIRIARRDGSGAPGMRAVAAELGTGSSSLYKHVRNHNDLIAGMIYRMTEGLDHPTMKDDPAEELENIFLTFYDLGVQDPWIIDYLMQGHPAQGAARPLIARAIQAVDALGLGEEWAWHGYLQLQNYYFGEVLYVTSLTQRYVDEIVDESSESVAKYKEGASPLDYRTLFRTGLRRLFRGFEVDKKKGAPV